MSFLSFLSFGVNLRVAEQIARLRTDVDAFSQHVVFAFAKTTFHHSDFCLCFLLAPYRFRFEHRGALSRRVALVPKRARLFARRFRLRARRFASLRFAFDRLGRVAPLRGERRARAVPLRLRGPARAVREPRVAPGVIQHGLELRQAHAQAAHLGGLAAVARGRVPAPAHEPGARRGWSAGSVEEPRVVRARGAQRRGERFERGGDERVVLGVVVPHRERARGTRISLCVASGRGARRKRHGARGCEVAARRRRSARVRSGAPNARAFTANAASAREANGVARARRAALVRATRAMRGVR